MAKKGVTYDELKEKYYNDEFPLFSDSRKNHLNSALDNWFGGTTFDEVQKITGIDPMDFPEADELPKNSKKQNRDGALDEAKEEWNKMSLEIKFSHFIDISDSAEELQRLIKSV